MAKMKPYRRAVAITGSYEDRDGNEKKRYVNIGTLFQYEDGNLALKLDSVPVGEGWNGFVSFYEIEDKRDEGRRQEPRREERREDRRGGGGSGGFGGYEGARNGGPRQGFGLDDEIPFVSKAGVL